MLIAARVDSRQVILEMACAGAGIALLPGTVACRRPELHPKGPLPVEGMGLDIWLLTHPDLRRAARVR